MNCLVLGGVGTGTVGNLVVHELAALGRPIRVGTRAHVSV